MIRRRSVIAAAAGLVAVGAATSAALVLRQSRTPAKAPAMGAPAPLSVILPAGLRAAALDAELGRLWIATRCDAANAADPLSVVLHTVDCATGALLGDPLELSRDGNLWSSGALRVIGNDVWVGFGDRLFAVDRTSKAVRRVPVPWQPVGDGEGGLLGDIAWDGADTLNLVVGSERNVRQYSLSRGSWSTTSLQGAIVGTTSTLGAWPGGFAVTAGNTTATRRDLAASAGGLAATVLNVQSAVVTSPGSGEVAMVTPEQATRHATATSRETSVPSGLTEPRASHVATDGNFVYSMSLPAGSMAFTIRRLGLADASVSDVRFPTVVTTVEPHVAQPIGASNSPHEAPVNPGVAASLTDGRTLWLITENGASARDPGQGSDGSYASIYRVPLG